MIIAHKRRNNTDVQLDVVTSSGASDYVKDGEVTENVSGLAVMVESESDLANLTGYPPTSIAYTAGFGSIWQLDADGTWQSV